MYTTHADRQVDEEDPVPGQRVGEHAAEQHADRAAAGHDEAEDAHRLRALARFGEQVHDQRERDRGDDGAADALHRACGDEQPLRGRQAARERRDREQRDSAQEQPARAEQVGEPPAEQQEAAEGQEVGVHDPRERRLREAEVVPDRRQRDVHDRRVEDDHQVAQTEEVQGEPAFAISELSHVG